MKLENMSSVVEEPTVDTEVETVDTQQEAAAPAQEEVADTGEEPGEADREPEIPHHVWAAARKKAEADAKRKMDALNSRIADRFKGKTNPATGAEIKTLDDYFAALDAQSEMRAKQQLQEKGVDPDLLDQVIRANPTVRHAEEVLAQQRQAEGERLFNEQMQKIHALDPGIKSIGDLQAMEEFGAFDAYVRSGMDMDAAFKLACFDRLTKRQAAAAKQEAINTAKSKAHLTATQGAVGQTQGVDIPADQLDRWKAFFPDATPAELREKYNRAINR